MVNANDVKVAAAVAGQGLARALAYQVTDEVRDGRLRVVLPAPRATAGTGASGVPGGRRGRRQVREFVRFAADRHAPAASSA